MKGRVSPIPFDRMMDALLEEHTACGTLFGVAASRPDPRPLALGGETARTPVGPAAGPHTASAQGIVSAWAAGARFFELKTVRPPAGEICAPRISAEGTGFSSAWDNALSPSQARDEYVKAWFALKLLSAQLGLGDPEGFIFEASLGCGPDALRLPPMSRFLDTLCDARRTAQWQQCRSWTFNNLHKLTKIDIEYINSISPRICRRVVLPASHGCPVDGLEAAARYLMEEKGLDVTLKLSPALLGADVVRQALDRQGWTDVALDEEAFAASPKLAETLPLLRRLSKACPERRFGVRVGGGLPVLAPDGSGEKREMTGRALFPPAVLTASALAGEFGGELPIAFSGGADAFNLRELMMCGVSPVTVCTALLGPGGSARLRQLCACAPQETPDAPDASALAALAQRALDDPRYGRPVKPQPPIRDDRPLPLLDCYSAGCRAGCPLGQDIPAYLRLTSEGRWAEALEVITERNPLPFITGTICPHPCEARCTRSGCDEAVDIRGMKLMAAQNGCYGLLQKLNPAEKTGRTAAVVGGGPAGLAAACLLARRGTAVTLFERDGTLGGAVSKVIPPFRIGDDIIRSDIRLAEKTGVEFVMGRDALPVSRLLGRYDDVILAVGAWKEDRLALEYGEAENALDFLRRFRTSGGELSLGESVAVVGGGNTAVDAARAALRVPGVARVSIVYRRTVREMPASGSELERARAEGVRLLELLSPLGVREGALLCEVNRLDGPDESGRRGFVSSGRTLGVPADTVIAAVGERPDPSYYAANGIALDGDGLPVTDSRLRAAEHVYIIGDGRRGPATVAEAIADALRVASELTGYRFDRWQAQNACAPSRTRLWDCRLQHRETGREEAGRCLECDAVCARCAEVCPSRANLQVDGQIVHLDALCDECGACGDFCPYGGAPWRDKYTLFSDAGAMDRSRNNGWLMLPNGKVRLRFGCQDDTRAISDCPPEVAKLIRDTDALLRRGTRA